MDNKHAPASCVLKIKVVPGASKSGISGWLGDALKVRVAEPPEKGKANKAIVKVIARALSLPVDAVSIIKGETSSRKVIQLHGISSEDLHSRLSDC